MRRRSWWVAALLGSVILLVAAWAGGCLVAGRDSPSNQCFDASAPQPVAGFNPDEHVNDPIEAWQLTNSHFTLWPTGLSCTYVNSNTHATGTSRYTTWGPSVAVVTLAIAATACLAGTLFTYRRRPRLLAGSR